jgi:RNA polymerase sigma-70 factor, ECF subfamily
MFRMDHESATFSVTSASLLERVRHRDPDGWARLSAIYGPLVYHLARRFGLSEADAADVVQEVFGVLSRKIDDYRGQGRFRAWLWTITRNKIRDHRRRTQERAIAAGGTEAYLHLQQLSDDASESWSNDEERRSAEQGVVKRTLELIRAEFEPTTWKAFWIATVEKRTAAEIAAELGITKHAVHQAKYRVLKRLREEFEGLE